jgi:dihydrofolate reductase
MRTLIVTEFMSLDGVIDSPGGDEGYPHAGWTFTDVPFVADAYEIKGREQEEAGALLLGRVSYQAFSPVWPTMAEFAHYNEIPKYVVSTTLTETDPGWNPTTILRSLDEVAALKEGDGGPIGVHGSATLAKSLLAAGLVDRFHLLVFPLVLGAAGKTLFDPAAAALTKLELVESQAYENGIIKAVYDVKR